LGSAKLANPNGTNSNNYNCTLKLHYNTRIFW
jgi:hypothetical protein